MALHRRSTIAARRVIAASAAVATAGMAMPAANAAEVAVPGTDIKVDVPGLEQYSLANLDSTVLQGIDVNAVAQQIQAHPVTQAIPGAADAINQAVATYESYVGAGASQDVIEAAPAASSVPAEAAPAVNQSGLSSSSGQAVVDAARSAMGSPYAWGAAGPGAFDCSGLTSWSYAQAGKSIPRTSQAQAASGTPVPLDQLQAGDIVTYYDGASHVGIYTGNGTIIDSLNEGTTVSERPIDYMPIHSAVRY